MGSIIFLVMFFQWVGLVIWLLTANTEFSRIENPSLKQALFLLLLPFGGLFILLKFLSDNDKKKKSNG